MASSIPGRHPSDSVRSRTVGTLAGRYASQPTAAHTRARPRIDRGSAYVDLSDMARAFVTMEVLGPPKALRDDF